MNEMREIQIKSTTSSNRKRRCLFMTELIHENGVMAKAQKRYSYFIAEQKSLPDGEPVKEMVEDPNDLMKSKPHQVFIKRIFDRDHGVGQTKYRTSGRFYVVQKFKIFAIIFVHSVTFDMIGYKPDLPA